MTITLLMAQTKVAPNDTPGKIDLNPKMAMERIDTWVDGAVSLLPNIIVATLVFLAFYFLAKLLRSLIHKGAKGRGRGNLGEVLGGFLRAVLTVFGGMIALTIVAPSLTAGELIGSLGVGSVAIGFAFQDILQNWLAGLLILVRQPFEVGDQIVVKGYEGTVEHIETRATLIRTYDGQRAVIPNSDIYTSPVLVRTAYETRRAQYDVGIGYGDDIDEACEIIRNVLSGIEGVASDPAPEALPWDLAASWVTVRARWWTDSPRSNIVRTSSKAIMAIKYALDDAGIDMPFETQVHLFHDQTEDRDGQPGAQREGWGMPKDGDVKPRWKAENDAGKTAKSPRKPNKKKST